MLLPVSVPGRLAACVAVSSSWLDEESVEAVSGAGTAVAVREVRTVEGRVHVLDVPTGRVELSYRAVVGVGEAPPQEVSPADELTFLRPSRYCPSDRLGGWASSEFAGLAPRAAVLAVEEWLHTQIAYTPGSTEADDDALHPLLTRTGVCRDFAHLGVSVCRALGIPARYAAVYAPGLDPMDFHAVFEATIDGRWYVFDGTRLAPRQSLVRIATGRDAADTALVTPLGAVLDTATPTLTVTAQPGLPHDDRTQLVPLT